MPRKRKIYLEQDDDTGEWELYMHHRPAIAVQTDLQKVLLYGRWPNKKVAKIAARLLKATVKDAEIA